ncbi:MAG: triose-phosphate isomerase [candidate division FCPU426 bacterium]
MRIPIIAGNWKLNKIQNEAESLAKEVAAGVRPQGGVEVVLCPPYTALASVRNAIRNTPVRLGAQDMFWEASGAFTGEVSGPMLADAGCAYVIIGHSERRQYFGETNETVNRKVKAALQAGLLPIVCVGETLPEREAGKVEAVVSEHVRLGLAGLSPAEMGKIVVAYEPVWAIGTGKTATPEQAQEVHGLIRRLLTDMAGADTAQTIRIQYGGSVKPDNVKQLMAKPDIDGALVGGASLKADSFLALVNYQSA